MSGSHDLIVKHNALIEELNVLKKEISATKKISKQKLEPIYSISKVEKNDKYIKIYLSLSNEYVFDKFCQDFGEVVDVERNLISCNYYYEYGYIKHSDGGHLLFGWDIQKCPQDSWDNLCDGYITDRLLNISKIKMVNYK